VGPVVAVALIAVVVAALLASRKRLRRATRLKAKAEAKHLADQVCALQCSYKALSGAVRCHFQMQLHSQSGGPLEMDL
jgi:hypothetical protein